MRDDTCSRMTPKMVLPSAASNNKKAEKTGLRYWMLQVLEECENVSADFSPDSVHDLRVSLRRCRSLADGLMALDPDPDWKAMKKAGKRLFQRLGELRDIHVMEEWIEKLEKASNARTVKLGGDLVTASTSLPDSDHPDSGTDAPDVVQLSGYEPASALLKILANREQEQKRAAKAALEEFDGKQWRLWCDSLPARAARVRAGSALFKHLALERWTEARELHSRALRNGSKVAFHSLRIGIKRFRYIVENFLPAEHKLWSDNLKEMQDVLGEVHDLDVLWSTFVSCDILADPASRQRWHERILAERSKRIERYRAKMVGPETLWQEWRGAMPQGKQIQTLATRRMKLWASRLDPDFPHSERVASLALQLYDGLLGSGWQPALDASSARFSLLAAALLHDVGKSEGEKGHHKASVNLIRKHGNPLGWKEPDLQRAAAVARFHHGALPTRKHKLLRDQLPDEQKATIQLAAILRLANALDAGHDGQIRRLRVENVDTVKSRTRGAAGAGQRTNGFLRKATVLAPNEALVIAAEGYSPLGSAAQIIAAERYLLETVLHRPVLMKPMKHIGNR